MAVFIEDIVINQGPNVGKSYYESPRGGTHAVVTVFNSSGFTFNVVLTLANQGVVSYPVPSNNSLALEVNGLLVVAILSSAAGAATGEIDIILPDF
jgi:hypothetical protein